MTASGLQMLNGARISETRQQTTVKRLLLPLGIMLLFGLALGQVVRCEFSSYSWEFELLCPWPWGGQAYSHTTSWVGPRSAPKGWWNPAFGVGASYGNADDEQNLWIDPAGSYRTRDLMGRQL